MRTKLFWCVLLLLAAGVTLAQDDFPPDPAVLFPDTVEVVAVENLRDQNVPYVLLDYYAREIVVVSADGMRRYPYPEDIATFREEITRLDAPDSLLLSGSVDYGPDDFLPYIFDMQTGAFTKYEPLCGEHSPIRPDAVWDYIYIDFWVLDVQPEGISLCATLTGQRTPPLLLPEDFALPLEPVPSVSSGDTHAVFAGASGDIYVYDFENDQTTLLGRCDACGQWGFSDIQWSNDSPYLALQVNRSNQCFTYAADMTAANSLTLVFESWPDCARLLAGSAQIVQMTYPVWEEGHPPTACKETVYDIATGEREVHDFGKLCQPDDRNYYREVADDRMSAEVVRFDPLTGERKTIYIGGEIEFVPWISDDERFGVLVLDDSGQIDYLPGEVVSSVWIFNPRFALVDFTASAVLYEQPLVNAIIIEAESSSPNLLAYASFPKFAMPRDDLLFIGNSNWHTESAQLIQLTDGEPIITEMGDVLALLPGSIRLLVWTEGRSASTAVHVYDIETGETAPIINAVDKSQYVVNVTKLISEDTVVVTVYPIIAGKGDTRGAVRYTIRF